MMQTGGVAEANYGWVRTEPEPGHAWFDPVVLELCTRVKPRRILDLGCGNDALCKRLAEAGYEVVGCDTDESGLNIARQIVPGTTFKLIGVYDDPGLMEEDPFELVISTEVIEHLFLPGYLPRFARRVLIPGGSLIVTTPYHGYLKNLVTSILDRWDAHHCVFWDCGHIKFFSRRTLTKLLDQEGFTTLAFRGAGRFPWFWNTMVLLARKR